MHGVFWFFHNDREEVACDEAELEPDEFAEKLQIQQKMQEKVALYLLILFRT